MIEEVAGALCDARVVRFGVFTYVSGRKGPIYVDMRVLPSTVPAMDAVTDAMAETVDKLGPDILAGAETAGIPLAAVLSMKTGIPMVYVRKKPKEHGTRSQVEGFLDDGQGVLLIDDMITDGGSKLGFIAGIREAGGEVSAALVVLDRLQGGSATLSGAGVGLHSLITLPELLDYMVAEGLLERERYDEVVSYLADPDEWERRRQADA